MFICVCKGITDSQIKQATLAGTNSMKKLRQELDLGTCCGSCVAEAKVIMQTTLISEEVASKVALLATPA